MKHGDWTLAPLHFAKVREAMHFAQNLLRQAGQPRMAKQWVLQDFHAPPSTCPALCAAMGQVKVATRNKIPRGPLQATYGCRRSKLSPHCLWHAAVIQTWTIGRWLWPWNMVVQQSKNGLTTWRTWEKHIIIFNFLNCWQLHSSTSYIYIDIIIHILYYIHIIYILYYIYYIQFWRWQNVGHQSKLAVPKDRSLWLATLARILVEPISRSIFWKQHLCHTGVGTLW